MSALKKGENSRNKRVLNRQRQKTRFLEGYAKSANVSAAAQFARVDRNKHYDWMRDDPEYPVRFAEAHQKACDLIDQEILRRGVHGWLEPVFYQGKKVSGVRKYDTTLLIFFAKGLMPEKYRENWKAEVNLTADVHSTHNLDLTKLTNEQLDALDTLYRAAAGVGTEPESNALGTFDGKTEESEEPDR